MSKEPADKREILLRGGEYKETSDTIENWLNFLTDPDNLQSGLPNLTVNCINHSGHFGSYKIYVTFDKAKASLQTLDLNLDSYDDKAMPVFMETDPKIIEARAADPAYGTANPFHLKKWIFGLFKQTELERIRIKFLNAELPDLFDQLPKLLHVDLYQSKLVRLPPSFYRLPVLKSLNISECSIKEVPAQLSQLKTLQSLTFTQPCAPAVLGSLRALTNLTCNSRAYNIPEEIGQLIDLKQLSFQSVSSAPENFLNFPKLEYLYFHVSDKHQSFKFTQANVPNLKKLNTDYPEAFATAIASFKKLEYFTTGDGADYRDRALAKSHADEFRSSLKQLTSLIHLKIPGLGISDINFCASLTNLEFLDVSRNAITHIPAGLRNLRKLKTFNLRRNRIEAVPETVNDLPSLTSLDLTDNPIAHSPTLKFKEEEKQRLLEQGGTFGADEPIEEWLTYLTNPRNTQAGLPDLKLNTGFMGGSSIEVSFDQHKASLRSIRLELNDFYAEEPSIFLETDSQTKGTGPDAYHLKKWVTNLFLHSELKELKIAFMNTALPDLFDQIAKLEVIDLSGSRLTTLPPSFCQLAALKTLSLRDAHLTELPVNFGQLENLVSLDLSGSKIKELPASFVQLQNVETLILDYTSITDLSYRFNALSNLKSISLTGTNLQQLPPALLQLPVLEDLVLEKTSVTELPDHFGKFVNLKKISLAGSKINRLPSSFFATSSLEWLDLRDSSLSRIPAELGHLKSLRYLSFSQPCAPTAWTTLNQLAELHCYCPGFIVPAEFSNLTNLKNLYFDSVSAASYAALNLPNLEKLEFKVSHGAAPVTLEARLPNLRNLTTNSLTTFVTGIRGSVNLEKIVAVAKTDQSGLQPLKESLKPLKKLTFLSLRGMGITDMDIVTSAITVDNLDLSENSIVHIPESLGNLQKLKTLVLNNNPLTNFPALPVMPSVSRVEFMDTEMPEDEESGVVQPDSEILKRMTGNFPNAILVYMK